MIEMLERVLMAAVSSIDWTALVWTVAVAVLYWLKRYVLDAKEAKWLDIAIESVMYAEKKGKEEGLLTGEAKKTLSLDKFAEIVLEDTGKKMKPKAQRDASKLIHRALLALKNGTIPKP